MLIVSSIWANCNYYSIRYRYFLTGILISLRFKQGLWETYSHLVHQITQLLASSSTSMIKRRWLGRSEGNTISLYMNIWERDNKNGIVLWMCGYITRKKTYYLKRSKLWDRKALRNIFFSIEKVAQYMQKWLNNLGSRNIMQIIRALCIRQIMVGYDEFRNASQT